jgi:hypothetical protein
MIENNKQRPSLSGIYPVIYSDNTPGIEFFNGNCWMVKYNHPVAFWFINTLN